MGLSTYKFFKHTSRHSQQRFMHMHIHTHTRTRTHANTHTHTHTRTHTHTYTPHTPTHAHTTHTHKTHTHARTHARTHTHTHTCTYIYVRARARVYYSAMGLKTFFLLFFKKKTVSRKIERTDRVSMTDRKRELVPGSWSLVKRKSPDHWT